MTDVDVGVARQRRNETMKQIIAYYRVSTKQQGVSGLGLEAQRKTVERYAEQNGDKIAAAYTEIERGER